VVLRLATSVATWPFYNFRYRKLMFELAKRFKLYVIAGSTLFRDGKDYSFKLVTVLPLRLPRQIRYRLSPLLAYTTINAVDPDVIWLFDTPTPIFPILKNAPIVLDCDDPRIILPMNELSRISRISLVNELRLLKSKKIRKIVVPTWMIKDKFVKLGVDEQKIEVIPNGVDTRLFTPTPLPDEPVVLYYGTFQPHRARLLLEVVEAVAKARRDVKFLLVGDIPPSVKNRLHRLLGDRVEMPGFVEHDLLPSFIQRARVCILPQDRSLGGRLPGKLLDYMACGRPVVATNVDESFPLKESGAGIVTEVDPEAMAQAAIKLLDDDRLAEELAEKGVEYARKYDWDRMVDDYVRLFHQVYSDQ